MEYNIIPAHGDHNHDDDDESQVLIAKGVSMVVLFCACMICGFLPLLLAKRLKWTVQEAETLRTKNKVVITLLSFGGGVLLTTTFMHLLPEIECNISQLQRTGELQEFDFSLANLLMIIGFFAMYLIEELVHLYLHRREKKLGHSPPLVRNLSVRRSHGTNEFKEAQDKGYANGIERKNDEEVNQGGHGHSHLPVIAADNITSFFRGLLIVLALSLHELFEGLAVGLESCSSHVWYMLGAIAAHKLILAFCIAVELIALQTKKWILVMYIVIYAVVTPLGIGIGMILVGGQGAAAAGIYSVVLQGIASGTLLYVIFFEIWSGPRVSFLKYVGALIGCALMFGLKLLTPHSHSHAHSEGIDFDGFNNEYRSIHDKEM